MGLFDYFKKKQETGAVKTIKLPELVDYIQNKKQELKDKEDVLLKKVFERLLVLLDILENKKYALDNVVMNEKIADEKVKFIVKENLFIYKRHLERLISELNSLEVEKHLVEKTNNLLMDFNKRSLLNYEKATFLIGKELGEIRDAINSFYVDIKLIVKDNVDDLKYNVIIENIDGYIVNLNELDFAFNDLKESIHKNKEKIVELEKEMNSYENKLNELKKSSEYSSYITAKLSLDNKKSDLKKDINELKNLIDFRKLSNLYHSDTRKMHLINDYKNDFLQAFEKDNLLGLLPLLSESGIDTSKVIETLDKVKSLIDELELEEDRLNPSAKDEIVKIEERIKTIMVNINYLNLEDRKEYKKEEKIEENKKEILNQIKDELRKIDIDLLI